MWSSSGKPIAWAGISFLRARLSPRVDEGLQIIHENNCLPSPMTIEQSKKLGVCRCLRATFLRCYPQHHEVAETLTRSIAQKRCRDSWLTRTRACMYCDDGDLNVWTFCKQTRSRDAARVWKVFVERHTTDDSRTPPRLHHCPSSWRKKHQQFIAVSQCVPIACTQTLVFTNKLKLKRKTFPSPRQKLNFVASF